MSKGGFVVLTILLTISLCWQFVPQFVGPAAGGIMCPCSSAAWSQPGCYVVCPEGDGNQLQAIGATIYVEVWNCEGVRIPGIPASDFWLIGCSDRLVLCGGMASINADSATGAAGITTITGSLAAGGCSLNGVSPVVQGVILADPTNCINPLCLQITTVSPDVAPSGAPDGVVDLIDLAYFAGGYTSPPNPLDSCIDFNCDGYIDIIDFSIFAQHYLHLC
jgi:hypothetical protein